MKFSQDKRTHCGTYHGNRSTIYNANVYAATPMRSPIQLIDRQDVGLRVGGSVVCHAIRLYVARVDEFYFLIYGSATVTDQLIIIIIRSVYDTSRIWYSKIWYN